MSKLETNTIDNISGSSTLTIGDSNASTISIPKNITLGASGTTITVPSGATITNNGTQTGFGGTNTPAFRAYLGSNATPANNTTTKVNIDTENFDTDNCYDNSSNYRFTPNVAGKYFVYAQLAYSSTVLAMNVKKGTTFIYKNGSELVRNINQAADSSSSNYSNQFTLLASTVVDMNGSSDYLEVYTNETVGTGSGNAPSIGNGNNQSFFGAYKIIT